MIRVLQCVNNMHRAGLETMLMNYYRNIDRKKIQFDFLVHRSERDDYDDEIESLGGRIYRAPRLYPQNYLEYFAFMKKFFREHPKYKIMHSHIDAMSYLPLMAGKRAGIPIRIAHSHSTSIDRDYKYPLKQLFRYRMMDAANYCCSCGEEAGEFLFRGREFELIPNAIDAKKFYFNPEMRQKKRKELMLEGKFVVGHVGRISYPKNHKFLVEIFYEILKREENAILALVGSGEKKAEIWDLVNRYGISNHVMFLGSRSDVDELYQAMDVFVLPSLFEGVPVVGVEAQFADLSCIFSDRVPGEVAFSEKSQFLSLDQSAEEWATVILESRGKERTAKKIVHTNFDIQYAHGLLEEYYFKLNKEVKE